jgi:ABC-type phosphate transport system permease subunit
MVFDVSVALTWILFLALFPMSFFWLRRAWRILFKRDFSEVALRRGEPPPNAERFAPYTGILNLVAGGVVATVIGLVLMAAAPYETWTAIAGSTIWCKFALDFAIGWHAHRMQDKPAEPKAR